jgi:2,4-dienoyl-CoA reductase-like NADH-dependent reductase (Old Yellow Enzyme family)
MRLSGEDDALPYTERIRREASIMTMAVGHIVRAEAILRDGKTDLIALARKLLYSPNWALDAAWYRASVKRDSSLLL